MNGPVVAVWWSRAAGDVRELARALLVEAAARALDQPAETITVAHEPSGRPCLTGGAARLHVGVSHCAAGAVAVVLSPLAPVGIDIEVVRPLPARRLAGRWMLPEESEWLATHPPDERVGAFLRLWTYKEAVGKAYGTGLRGGGLRRPMPVHRAVRPELRAIPGDPQMAAAGLATGDIVLAVACGSRVADGLAVAVTEVPGG